MSELNYEELKKAIIAQKEANAKQAEQAKEYEELLKEAKELGIDHTKFIKAPQVGEEKKQVEEQVKEEKKTEKEEQKTFTEEQLTNFENSLVNKVSETIEAKLKQNEETPKEDPSNIFM